MNSLSINEKKTERINALLLVMYMFASPLTLPLVNIFESELPTWTFKILIILYSLFINKMKFNTKFIIFCFFMFSIFLTNIIIVDFKFNAFLIMVEHVKWAFALFYLATMVKDYGVLLKYWYNVAIIVLCIFYLFIGDVISREIDYMYFGEYMTLCFIIFNIALNRKLFMKKVNIIFFFSTLIPIIFIANRSSILICFAVILYFEFASKSKNFIYKYFKRVIISMFIIVFYFKFKDILVWLHNYFLSYNINLYPIRKMLEFLEVGLIESSSGRDVLFENSLSLIKSNNYLPGGIGFYQYATQSNYPHNIFLDLLITFGFLGIIIFIAIFAMGLIKYSNLQDESLKMIIVMLFIYNIIRLNFSGMFWNEEVFWVLIGLLFFSRDKSSNFNQKEKVFYYKNKIKIPVT